MSATQQSRYTAEQWKAMHRPMFHRSEFLGHDPHSGLVRIRRRDGRFCVIDREGRVVKA